MSNRYIFTFAYWLLYRKKCGSSCMNLSTFATFESEHMFYRVSFIRKIKSINYLNLVSCFFHNSTVMNAGTHIHIEFIIHRCPKQEILLVGTDVGTYMCGTTLIWRQPEYTDETYISDLATTWLSDIPTRGIEFGSQRCAVSMVSPYNLRYKTEFQCLDFRRWFLSSNGTVLLVVHDYDNLISKWPAVPT